MENFEVLETYPRIDKVGGTGAIFDDKLLLRYKHSDIEDPFVLPPAIFVDIERVKNFEVHSDDVFLCGFPRSGTTFMQEMIWLISHDFDFESANKLDVYNRAQWFDLFSHTRKIQGVDADHIEKLERPRVLKTHYPVQLLPPQIWEKNAKVIFISRDVKDVAVSNYFFRKIILHEVPGSIEEHFDEFLDGKVFFGPYREYLTNFQTLKDKTNVLFLTYEECVGDMQKAIKKVAKFLDKEASIENVEKLAAHLDFKTFKKNPNTNVKHYLVEFNRLAGHNEDPDNFIRRGKAGGYNEDMSEDYAQVFDNWMNEC